MTDRRLDLVLHGATGYVGQLTARHLAERAGGLRVGLSGRSEQRLRAVRNELRVDWPLLVTDASDRASLIELAAASAVVATTVGPYRPHTGPSHPGAAQAEAVRTTDVGDGGVPDYPGALEILPDLAPGLLEDSRVRLPGASRLRDHPAGVPRRGQCP